LNQELLKLLPNQADAATDLWLGLLAHLVVGNDDKNK
jgi:hypothetical protein